MCYSLGATQKSEWHFQGWGTARFEKHYQGTISEATILSASQELLGLRARTTADQKSDPAVTSQQKCEAFKIGGAACS